MHPAPFFAARKRGDAVTVRGQHACDLGHALAPAGQTTPDGVFARWRWDGRSLTVTNDRYGFYPLCYWGTACEFAISPSLPTLLEQGAPLDVDAGALAAFLQLGFFIGDDTPFRHIKVVPPDASLTWNGSVELTERRQLGATLEISRPDAVEEYRRLFRAAIEKRLPKEEFAVPLSGGHDSRHILLELLQAGARPRYCVTARQYEGGYDDVGVARRLAGTLDLEHVVVEPLPRVEAELRKNVATSFCADEHAWLVPVADRLAGSVGTIYDGIGGDVLSASLFQHRPWLDLYRAGRLDQLAAALLGRSAAMVQRTLDPAFRTPAGGEIARERLVRELERYAGAANPVTMFFFWNRTRREIALAPFGLFADVETCFCPYLDHELFDFLASLPPEVTIDKRFHTETIGRAHPAHAGIPYARPLPGRTTAAAAALGGRVMWHGLRTRPARLGRFVRVAAQTGRFAVSRAYRRRNAVLSPALLLYLCQLEDVTRELAGRRM